MNQNINDKKFHKNLSTKKYHFPLMTPHLSSTRTMFKTNLVFDV